MAKIGIIRIKKIVDALLEFVKQDYAEKLALETNKETDDETNYLSESFLYRCFDDDDKIDKADFRNIAISLFTREVINSNKIETRLLFDRDRASLPTIHVREPAKQKGKQDGIGNIDEDYFIDSDGSFSDARRRSFESQYELMITSVNRHEVIIIEEVLLALLIGAQDSLALQEPFYNLSFNVKELMFNGESMPNVFIKAIGLNVTYDKHYPDISNNDLLSKILFEKNILT